MTETSTASFVGQEAASSERALRCPHLTLVFDGSSPLADSARFALFQVHTVEIGRGTRRQRVRRDTGTLSLEVPNAWMSSEHARLVCEAEGWFVVDAGSKNGTFINGRRIERARLDDGDLLSIGNTYWLFRADVVLDEPTELDVEARATASRHLVTLDAELAQTLAMLERVAASDIPILISGATGTGKELVARAVHDLSERSGRFIGVNCAALSGELLGSELFGARRGAYTGATEDRTGLVRASAGGTLFLDEISELPESSQAALLRVLQEKEVMPIGGTEAVAVDIRVVAATNRNARELVDRGQFRADLYARLCGFHVHLPALAERREDLGLLIGALMKKVDPERASRLRFDRKAAEALMLYGWPFNIRELEHALRTAMKICDGDELAFEALPEDVRNGPKEAARSSEVDAGDRERLVRLLEQHRGNVSEVASALQTSRSQVRRLAKRHGVDPETFRRRPL